MSVHLIIDGYNLIRRSDSLHRQERQALELGRQALVDRLSAYKRLKGHKVTVVFDGSQKYVFPDAKTTEKGVRIRFSRHGESADAVIRQMAAREREKAMVISADSAVAEAASASGATVVPPEAFEEKMEMAQMIALKGDAADMAGDPDAATRGGTRKKGPGKRLPKAKRRRQRKIEKL